MLYQRKITHVSITSHNTHAGFIDKLSHVTIQVLDAIEHLVHV